MPCIGKLLEKVIATRLVEFFDKHELLSECQFGFRKNYNTELAIIDIYEKLLFNSRVSPKGARLRNSFRFTKCKYFLTICGLESHTIKKNTLYNISFPALLLILKSLFIDKFLI